MTRSRPFSERPCFQDFKISLPEIIASLDAAVFASLSALHVFWAMGGKLGAATVPEVGGKPVFVPSRTATVLVALALAVASTLVLARVGLLPFSPPRGMVRVATLALGGVFVVRAVGDFRLVGFFKRVRGTRFARYDTLVFSPLSFALGASALWLGCLP